MEANETKTEGYTVDGKPKMKKQYDLKCLYPATKQYADQSYKKIINADRFWTENGAYFFAKSNGTVLACYPIQYTIIEKIIDND